MILAFIQMFIKIDPYKWMCYDDFGIKGLIWSWMIFDFYILEKNLKEEALDKKYIAEKDDFEILRYICVL